VDKTIESADFVFNKLILGIFFFKRYFRYCSIIKIMIYCKPGFKVFKICLLYFSCILFALIFPFKSLCQENYNEHNKNWRLSAGIVFNLYKVTDKNFSTLTYRGSSPGAAVALRYEGKHAQHEIAALYISNANLSTNTSPQAKLNSGIFNMEYVNIYSLYVSSNNLFNCKAGAGIQFLNNSRKFNQFINNDFSFETALSFGAVAQLQYGLGKNNNSIILTTRITLPLFFIFSQPSYSGTSAEDQEAENGTAFKKLFTNTKTGSFSGFLRIKNEFAINKNLGNHHGISIIYNWEFYKIKTARSVIAASNQAGIQYNYKF
jgi:hypothetical protein